MLELAGEAALAHLLWGQGVTQARGKGAIMISADHRSHLWHKL